jgi:hypothetical protein
MKKHRAPVPLVVMDFLPFPAGDSITDCTPGPVDPPVTVNLINGPH